MAELRASGLDLIREYIPDSPEYNPEDEPGQYNIPYVPQSQPPEVPDYQPSATTNVPEHEEEEAHVKFADPPASLHQQVMSSWTLHLVSLVYQANCMHQFTQLLMLISSFIQKILDHQRVDPCK